MHAYVMFHDHGRAVPVPYRHLSLVVVTRPLMDETAVLDFDDLSWTSCASQARLLTAVLYVHSNKMARSPLLPCS